MNRMGLSSLALWREPSLPCRLPRCLMEACCAFSTSHLAIVSPQKDMAFSTSKHLIAHLERLAAIARRFEASLPVAHHLARSASHKQLPILPPTLQGYAAAESSSIPTSGTTGPNVLSLLASRLAVLVKLCREAPAPHRALLLAEKLQSPELVRLTQGLLATSSGRRHTSSQDLPEDDTNTVVHPIVMSPDTLGTIIDSILVLLCLCFNRRNPPHCGFSEKTPLGSASAEDPKTAFRNNNTVRVSVGGSLLAFAHQFRTIVSRLDLILSELLRYSCFYHRTKSPILTVAATASVTQICVFFAAFRQLPLPLANKPLGGSLLDAHGAENILSRVYAQVETSTKTASRNRLSLLEVLHLLLCVSFLPASAVHCTIFSSLGDQLCHTNRLKELTDAATRASSPGEDPTEQMTGRTDIFLLVRVLQAFRNLLLPCSITNGKSSRTAPLKDTPQDPFTQRAAIVRRLLLSEPLMDILRYICMKELRAFELTTVISVYAQLCISNEISLADRHRLHTLLIYLGDTAAAHLCGAVVPNLHSPNTHTPNQSQLIPQTEKHTRFLRSSLTHLVTAYAQAGVLQRTLFATLQDRVFYTPELVMLFSVKQLILICSSVTAELGLPFPPLCIQELQKRLIPELLLPSTPNTSIPVSWDMLSRIALVLLHPDWVSKTVHSRPVAHAFLLRIRERLNLPTVMSSSEGLRLVNPNPEVNYCGPLALSRFLQVCIRYVFDRCTLHSSDSQITLGTLSTHTIKDLLLGFVQLGQDGRFGQLAISERGILCEQIRWLQHVTDGSYPISFADTIRKRSAQVNQFLYALEDFEPSATSKHISLSSGCQ